MGVEGIPFISNNIDELKVLHKYLRPEYEKVALKNNQTILYMVPWPTQYLHLKVKCESLDALKGIKIRVPDKNAQDMCSAIGMAPALIPWGETIAALSSGAVSGVLDLVGVGRRRQVLGVPQVLPPDQPRLVVPDRHDQQRHAEEDLAGQPEGDDRPRQEARARLLADLAQGRRRQQQEADRRWHADRDPARRRWWPTCRRRRRR
jgi:hypothetical protein